METSKQLSRRSFIRSIGVSAALPVLGAMGATDNLGG